MDTHKKIFLQDTSVWTHILLDQFQNRPWFETELGKTRPFPSHIQSSIPLFWDMPLHLLV